MGGARTRGVKRQPSGIMTDAINRNTNNDSPPSALQDLIGGALAIAFGAFVLSTAASYPMGSLLRMGPGFFPIVLAALIVALGAALVLHAFRARIVWQPFVVNSRPMAMIALAVALFGLSLERFGLAPATMTLILVSSLAESRWRPWRALLLAATMTAAVYVIFILVLQMPFAVVTW